MESERREEALREPRGRLLDESSFDGVSAIAGEAILAGCSNIDS